jgi:hypothetical protein
VLEDCKIIPKTNKILEFCTIGAVMRRPLVEEGAVRVVLDENYINPVARDFDTIGYRVPINKQSPE